MDDEKVDTANACLFTTGDDEKSAESDESTSSISEIDSAENANSNLKLLGKFVDFICMVKDTVITFFKELGRRYLRRQRRLFAQGKISRIRVKWWSWIDSIIDAAKNLGNYILNAGQSLYEKAKSVASKFTELVKDGIDLVTAKANQVTDWVKEKLKSVFSIVGKWIDSLKEKFIRFFESKWFKALTNFITCVTSGPELFKEISERFKNIPTQVMRLIGMDPIAWIKLIVNMICGWEKLKNAFVAFKTAWNAVGPTKWQNYGKFAGYLISFIADALSRRRRRHY